MHIETFKRKLRLRANWLEITVSTGFVCAKMNISIGQTDNPFKVTVTDVQKKGNGDMLCDILSSFYGLDGYNYSMEDLERFKKMVNSVGMFMMATCYVRQATTNTYRVVVRNKEDNTISDPMVIGRTDLFAAIP